MSTNEADPESVVRAAQKELEDLLSSYEAKRQELEALDQKARALERRSLMYQQRIRALYKDADRARDYLRQVTGSIDIGFVTEALSLALSDVKAMGPGETRARLLVEIAAQAMRLKQTNPLEIDDLWRSYTKQPEDRIDGGAA